MTKSTGHHILHFRNELLPNAVPREWMVGALLLGRTMVRRYMGDDAQLVGSHHHILLHFIDR